MVQQYSAQRIKCKNYSIRVLWNNSTYIVTKKILLKLLYQLLLKGVLTTVAAPVCSVDGTTTCSILVVPSSTFTKYSQFLVMLQKNHHKNCKCWSRSLTVSLNIIIMSFSIDHEESTVSLNCSHCLCLCLCLSLVLSLSAL